MTVIEKLNALAPDSILGNVPNYYIEIGSWEDSTSTTTLFDKDNDAAFTLNPVVAVPVKEYYTETPKFKVPEDYKGAVAVHRAYISLGAAVRGSNSLEALNLVLQTAVNAGIKDLINQIGNLRGYRLSGQLPDNSYFRLVDDVNAVEFRLFVFKE